MQRENEQLINCNDIMNACDKLLEDDLQKVKKHIENIIESKDRQKDWDAVVKAIKNYVKHWKFIAVELAPIDSLCFDTIINSHSDFRSPGNIRQGL